MASVRLAFSEELEGGKNKGSQWIHEWIDGNLSEEESLQYLRALIPDYQPKGAVVCVCSREQDWRDSLNSFNINCIRYIFRTQSFYLLSVIEKKYFIFVLVNLKESDWKERVSNALIQIRQSSFLKLFSKETLFFGVGKFSEFLSGLSGSFQTAIEMIDLQKKGFISHECIYENLHIYRLVLLLQDQGNINEYINEYVGPVIAYDKKHNSELLHTLVELLEANGSKNDAAKRLFIVRQTLYHRLEKLKELLGEDYMEPRKRAAIEFSLYAFRFLNHATQISASEKQAIQ